MKTPRKAKMTMKVYEKTAYDERMDKLGKHGKEGSAKDKRLDMAAMKKMSAGKLSMKKASGRGR